MSVYDTLSSPFKITYYSAIYFLMIPNFYILSPTIVILLILANTKNSLTYTTIHGNVM